MITHPAAEAARAAMAANRYELASQILDAAPEVDSQHPDLLAERAWMLTLRGREDSALAMLPGTESAPRHEALRKVLAEHYRCRFQLDPRDTIARNACAEFRDVDIDLVGTRLSACIIAKNEAKNLPRCMESLLDIVDEIVVLDTGSTDRTVAIAIEFGAVVGATAWQNDFAAARNAALDLSTGDWVLWIDADEELTRDSFPAIRRALCRPHFGGFDLEIVNLVDETDDGAQILHYPTRLFRRLPEVRFTGAIHEQIQPSLAALGLPWARLEGARLLHHGYRPSALADGKKLERTRTMLEDAVRQNPGDGFQWFNLANANLTEKRHPEAAEAAENALRTIRLGEPWRDLTWQILAAAHYRQGQYLDALHACERCDLAGENNIFNEYERAQALQSMGRLPEALDAIDKCLSFEWGRTQTGDVGVATYKRYFLRGQILASLGEYEEAHLMYDVALEGNSGFAPARLSRALLLEKIGKPELAIADYERVRNEPTVRAAALKGLGRALFSTNQSGAVDALNAAWHENPEDRECWQMWLAAARAEGDVASILAAYGEFQEVGTLLGEELVDWGRTLHQAGDLVHALEKFTRAIETEPRLTNAYFNAGDLLYQVGVFVEAAKLYEAALRIDSEHPDGWFMLGNCLAQLNMDEGARVAYDQTLRLNACHGGALHNRGQLAA